MKVDEETILWIKTNTLFRVCKLNFCDQSQNPPSPYIRSFTGQTGRRWLLVLFLPDSSSYDSLARFLAMVSLAFLHQSLLCLDAANQFFFLGTEQSDGKLPNVVFPSIPQFSCGPSSSNTSFHNSFSHSVVDTSLLHAYLIWISYHARTLPA
jgi:hypothetical protein